MMTVNNHVPVAVAIQPFELRLGPLILFVVSCDVGIERDDKNIAVAEREDRIARQTPRRSFGRDQLGVGRKEVLQPRLPARVAVRRGARQVVVARREEIRHAAFLRQAIDQINIARVPLPPDLAVGHTVSGLNHESNREGGLFELLDRGDRGVDDQRVLVLKLEPVAPPARVAVDYKGETIYAGGIFFARQRRARRFDRAYRLVDRFRRQRRLLLNSWLLRLLRSLRLRILPRREREYTKQRGGRR